MSDGLPWDLALIPLKAGERILPTIVLRPRPVPRLDAEKLGEHFLAWRKDHSLVFKSAHAKILGWTTNATPAWPPLEQLMSAGDAAVRHVETREPDAVTSEVHDQAPWLFLLHPRLTGIAAEELQCTPETAPRDVHGARLQAERDGTWPPLRRAWSPGADTVTFLRAAALLTLRERPERAGRLFACFASGEDSDAKDESQLSAVKALSAVGKRRKHPWMQPLIVPIARDSLVPDPRGSLATLAQWLLDGRGARALQWMFGSQAERLAFKVEDGGIVRGLSVLGRRDQAQLVDLTETDEAFIAPYLASQLVFRSED